MKKTSFFVAGLMAMTMATSAMAAKIGVVNPERILRESTAAEQAQVTLQKEFDFLLIYLDIHFRQNFHDEL